MKKLKIMLLTGFLASSFMTTVVHAENNYFNFALSVYDNSYTRTPAYAKDDGEGRWYYKVTSYQNHDDNDAEIYFSACDSNNNIASGWVSIPGTCSTKSKAYSWGVSHTAGTRFKLQARCDRYIASLGGQFCP